MGVLRAALVQTCNVFRPMPPLDELDSLAGRLDEVRAANVAHNLARMREAHTYTFRVDPRANKLEIRDALETMFGVHATRCRVINVKGKPKRVRYRKGYTAGWKKAIVTLPPGETISIFEGA